MIALLRNTVHDNSHGIVVVDCDQTGLIANGKSFELAKKGYFSKKKIQSGYQVSASFVGNNADIVAMFLDSSNYHCTFHYDDLLKSILSKYKEQLRDCNLILGIDSGFGSTENIKKLQSIPKLKFVTKAYSIRTPSTIAKGIDYSEYNQTDESA